MGTWGVGLYANDLAADARNDFNDVFSVKSIQDGIEIFKHEYLKEIHEDDLDELANFWYALGDFMWNKGILTEEVKKSCFELLEQNAGLDLWIEEGNKSDIKKRKDVLEKFKIKLNTPMPPKKKIKSSAMHCRWNVGDIIAFKPSKDWTYTEKIRWNWDLLTNKEIFNLQNQGYKKEGYQLVKDYSLWDNEGFKKQIIAYSKEEKKCSLIFDVDYKTLINTDDYMFAICVEKSKSYFSKWSTELYHDEVYFAVYDYYGKIDKNIDFSKFETSKRYNRINHQFEEFRLDDCFSKNILNLGEFKKIANNLEEANRLKYVSLISNEGRVSWADDCFIYYDIQNNPKIHISSV